ncbi:MAG TPA: sigma-70 family RNA polymerase sigma factor [Actinophytocola sp.]|uniref:RNA polymerase sigma factor n=1 Tax=Actinophytocola sp. TaxID=1872138 RepID=UPI002DB86E7B|nr:sigma-70 family RNA polymerase sigma factor [Actinophytocola sp.]HEU5476190.1 sigma-70 family RNA polymerase sigma factor [Actinophytocola sp.]
MNAEHPSGADLRLQRIERLAACLTRAKEGDLSALDSVVRELNPLLWRVARSQGLSDDDAADAVQTTWLELVRQLAVIHSPLALTSWLVRATKREAWRVNARRRKSANPGHEALDDAPDDAPAPDDRLLTHERDRTLWRHFARLSERCRTLLALVAYAERPDYAAIVEALGMPHGSIGPTRGRCLAKLRAMLLADPEWCAA